MRFLTQLKYGKIAGHPVHVMLIHFPSALFPISLAFDILGIIMQDQNLSWSAFYCLAAGLLMGSVAILFGAIDYSRIPAKHPSWNKASLHGLLNIIWYILFGIVFGLKLKQYPQIGFASNLEMIISSFAVMGLIFSNYLGGELVSRFKLGYFDKL